MAEWEWKAHEFRRKANLKFAWFHLIYRIYRKKGDSVLSAARQSALRV